MGLRFPVSIPFFKVTDTHTVVILSVFFEENDGQKLVLGIISPPILTGIQVEMG